MKKVTVLYEYPINRYTYRYFLIADDDVGYVVITCNHELDFSQCMCCWSDQHAGVGKAIKENRGKLSKVTICGTDSNYNAKLGVDATFSDLTLEERAEIQTKITTLKGEIDQELRVHRVTEENVAVVRRLIREFRYEDARTHCAVCGLDYERFLEEARKAHMPNV